MIIKVLVVGYCCLLLCMRNGDQFPWMDGVWVCQCFRSLVGLVPDDVLILDINASTSSTVRLGMGIT